MRSGWGRVPGYPDDQKPRGAVGVYGIGMKRAIFKMGGSCVISTQREQAGYEVTISPQWLQDEDDWDLPFSQTEHSGNEDGTRIVVRDLYDGIATEFGDQRQAFESTLDRMVSTHYSFIIDKGFRVTVNESPVRSSSRGFVYTPGVARMNLLFVRSRTKPEPMTAWTFTWQLGSARRSRHKMTF